MGRNHSVAADIKSPKIHRRVDLRATLLTHRFPVRLEEIVRKATLRRMFSARGG